MPRPSVSTNKINHGHEEDKDRVIDVTEQKILSHQRLARYFNQPGPASGHLRRRESSPADINQDMSHDHPLERVVELALPTVRILTHILT